MRNFPELPGLDPALELLPDFGIRGFSHTAHERRFKNRAAILHSRSLENMIACPGYGPLRLHLRVMHSMLPVLTRLGDYVVSLMPILLGQLPVPP